MSESKAARLKEGTGAGTLRELRWLRRLPPKGSGTRQSHFKQGLWDRVADSLLDGILILPLQCVSEFTQPSDLPDGDFFFRAHF